MRNIGMALVYEDGTLVGSEAKTNADRIRAMSDEGIAALLCKITGECPPGESWDECPKDRGIRTTCQDCWLKYLSLPDGLEEE